MHKECNTLPFTKRLLYQVEEISVEEFIEALNQNRNLENKAYFQQIRTRIEQLSV